MSHPDPKLIETVASEAFDALEAGRQIAPFSSRLPEFDLRAAYAVTAQLRRMREARGERHTGRKIGFTNRALWTQFGVEGPMWGDVYVETVRDISAIGGRFSLKGLPEPLIEPEIMLTLAAAPEPGMDEAALLACVESIALGFEIVQSIFGGWKFKQADTVAAGSMHAALLVGPQMRIDPSRPTELTGQLSGFTIALRRNGETVDQGRGSNVLDSPLFALKYLAGMLAADGGNPPLRAGEIISTGTLTRAMPIAPGETWSTAISGIGLRDISVTFA